MVRKLIRATVLLSVNYVKSHAKKERFKLQTGIISLKVEKAAVAGAKAGDVARDIAGTGVSAVAGVWAGAGDLAGAGVGAGAGAGAVAKTNKSR